MHARIFHKVTMILPLLAGLLMGGCAELQMQRNQLAAQESSIRKLRDENKQFQDAYYKIKDQLDNQNSQSQKRVDQLTRELEQTRALRTQKEKELGDQLRTRNVEFEALKNETLDQKMLLEAQVAQLQQGLQTTIIERDTTLAKLKDTDEKLRTEQTRSADLTQQVARFKVDLKTSNDQVAGLQKDLADRDTALKEEKQARQSAEQKLGDTEKQLADQGQQLQDAKARLGEAQTRIEAADKVQGTLEQLRQDKEALASELATTRSRHEKELTAAKTSAAKAKAAPAAPTEDSELKLQAESLGQRLRGLDAAQGVQVKTDGRRMRVIVPSAILFEDNKATLTKRAAAVMSPIAEALKKMGNRPVQVEGHTDDQEPQGLYADNWVFGFARADRVREFLMKDGGINAGRLTALSRAQFDPQASNDTPEGRRQNRRVEIVVGAIPAD